MSKSAASEAAGDSSSSDPSGMAGAESDVDLHPVAADAPEVVDRKISSDLRQKYEIYSYKNAAVILSEVRQVEFGDICLALREFSITSEMIRKAGGNESEMPRVFSKALRPLGWHETVIRADLHVSLRWREATGLSRTGRPITAAKERTVKRDGYLDGHKIDYVRVRSPSTWNGTPKTKHLIEIYTRSMLSSFPGLSIARSW
jgi:Restriction endonuclease BglII